MIQCEKGFTLLEMLVAVMILSVGLLGLAQLQVAAIQTNSQSNSLVVASALAQSVLEDINRISGDDPMFSGADQLGVVWAAQTDVPGGGSYKITYNRDRDYNGLLNVTKIDIRVESLSNIKTALGSQKRVVTLTTLKRYF
ncbi:type IV pilus modification PilV family protein [Trichloromonas sp.]|uniref:type IV pilus modification PilV family protein n=1 Tax=Trichloromonas sp. TaxID=3069249 RepID=UPI003D81A6FD